MPPEEEIELSDRRTPSESHNASSRPTTNPLLKGISTWWTTNISIVLPMDVHDPRDHLALERTFLAYLRTSNAVVLLAVAMAQLYILRDGKFLLGKVISSVTVGIGIFVALLGGAHYLRQQRALIKGKVVLEGEIMWGVFMLVGTISVAMFVVTLAAG